MRREVWAFALVGLFAVLIGWFMVRGPVPVSKEWILRDCVYFKGGHVGKDC